MSRLTISPQGLVLLLDKTANGPPAVPIATLETTVAPSLWHKAVVEVRGAKMTAQLDGKQSLSGVNARVDVDKVDFGFPVFGASASLDSLRVYAVEAR